MTEDNNLGLEFKYLIVNDMDRKFGLWVNTCLLYTSDAADE